MGNTPLTIGLKVHSNSNNNHGGGVVAGSMLNGTVYLSNKHKSNTIVHASSIKLRLIGTEEAVVHHQTTEMAERNGHHGRQGQSQPNSSYTQDHYERSSDIIYSVDHIIKEFPNGRIPNGQFEFPFALQLPKYLPSSMKSVTGESHCQVRYEITAEIFQKPNTLFHKNQQSQESLTIVAMPSTSNNTPRTLPTEIVPISNCHCCRCFSCTKIGTVALETRFDTTTLLLDAPSLPSSFRANRNNHSTPNATKSFGVQFRCENKSTASFRTIQAKLTETVEWKANGHTKSITKTLSSSKMEASGISELNAMWRKPFFFEEHKYNNNNNTSNETSLLLQHKPWRSIHLGVEAQNALDTYNGRAVQVRHVLTLTAITKDCCTTNPDASTRVELFRNPILFGVEQPQCCGFANAAATAPFEDEPSFGQSTAPPDYYDSKNNNHHHNDSSKIPMVEARLVLPEDWNAHAEEVVNIPIAEAMVVDR